MDAANLLSRSQTEGWALVALDLGVDTTTPTGELVASVMAAVSQWERRAIAQRTRDALAAKRERGEPLGRHVNIPEEVGDRIKAARESGKGWTAIANDLNQERVPTARTGAKWYPSTVQAVVRRLEAQN